MKRKLLFFALCLASSFAGAQSPPVNGQLSVSAASCAVGASPTACLFLQVAQNIGIVTVDLEGTFSATVQFEQSSDGGNTWRAVTGNPSSAGAGVTSATGVGTWQISSGAYHYIRVRVSTYASGTVIATLTPSKAGSAASNGFNGGSLPASATVLGTNSSGQPVDNSLIAPVLSINLGTANSTAALTTNVVNCNGFLSGPFGGTFTKVSYDVTTADNTANVYDLGISNATTGARVCHTGPQAGTVMFPATGISPAGVVWAASCTIQPNTKYLVTLTSSGGTPAGKLGGSLYPSFQGGNTCGSSASGTIPDPLNTIPSDSYSQVPVPALTLHN